MRAFWTLESDPTVAKLLKDMLDYAAELGVSQQDPAVYEASRAIVERLKRSAPAANLAEVLPSMDEKGSAILAESVRESIESNKPEAGLDHLHTFTVKYLRVLCAKRWLNTDKDKPLHSLMGEYLKKLRQSGDIESDMSELILKSTISTLEAFNRVRNDQSFAHDNAILNPF